MRQRGKHHAILRNCCTIFITLSPGIKKMFEITLTTGMRQRTFDCYDIIEQSACLTQASTFYIAVSRASIVCDGSRVDAYRVSVNAPILKIFRSS